MCENHRQNHSILVVDDEKMMVDFVSKVLKNNGYDVLAFTSPEKALKALKDDNDISIIITDVHMLEMDGLTFMEDAMALNPQLISIAITGDKDVNVAVDSIRRGASDFLQKPIKVDKLVDVVKNAELIYEARFMADTHIFEDLPAEQSKVKEKRIGNYKLLDVIGQGSCGTVYRARKEDDPLLYAVKVMHGLPDKEEHRQRTQRFLNEGKALSQIRHPNIVQLVEHGVFCENSIQYPYIVMEYFHGKRLRGYLDNIDSLDLEQKIEIIKQIANGLQAVHEKNIYHRDIKPENILVSESLHTVIVDFGVCHLPFSELTITGSLIGTPCYLSPEQLLEGMASQLSDVYALGIISYEMFLGIKPFSHDIFHKLVHKIVHEYPIEPRRLNPDFPLELQNIMAKMIDKNPKKRYQTGKDAAADLEVFLQNTKHDSFYDKLKHIVMFQKHWA